MRSGALRWVFLPVFDGDHDARNDESQEQRNEKIFPRAKGVLILGVADHEIPEIRERGWHGASPMSLAETREFEQRLGSNSACSPGSSVHRNVITRYFCLLV